MPFKRNPIVCERIDSLARLLVGYADVAWQNAATNYLERTLDDSANRRTILPEALLCADEIISLARKVIDGLRVDERRIAHNLRTYGPFAGTEAVMMEAARAGADRQELHESIRVAAMEAWAALARGRGQPALANCSPPTKISRRASIRPRSGACSIRASTSAPRRSARACWPIASKRSTHFPVKKWYRYEQRHRDRPRQDEGPVRVSGSAGPACRRADRRHFGGRRRAPERDRRQRPSCRADDGARISPAEPLRFADALPERRRRRRRQRDGRAALQHDPARSRDARRRGGFVRQAEPRRRSAARCSCRGLSSSSSKTTPTTIR